MLHYLTHKNIEKEKWDACIDMSDHSKIYALSWYLDIVCPDWDAIIEDDYLSVMPVTKRKKYGFQFLYPPVFAQQLGIFSPDEISHEKILKFILILKNKYKYMDIHLNNKEIKKLNFSISPRVNCLLNIEQSYYELRNNFSDNTKRNLKNKTTLLYSSETQPKEFLQFVSLNERKRINPQQRQILESIVNNAFARNMGEISAVRNSLNQIIAGAFFLQYKNTFIYLYPVSSKEGKIHKAMFFLLDNFIRMHASNKEIIDFEGSNIDGIKRFYLGFGANIENYYNLTINNLPWPLKIFKK